jgi:F-type H+-transporting ATPase subunit a
MTISPDDKVLWEYGFAKINVTLVDTWAVMIVMVVGSYLITRRLRSGINISRWQSILEMIVITIKLQIEEVGLHRAEKYISFLGTLFLFLFVSNLFTILPAFIFEPPTSSLSTTAGLAISVFFAVPVFNIMEHGIVNYLKSYVKPVFIMLPFHIISEFSRTVALAVRLFGNMMSGAMILGILLTITPFIFPDIMIAFGLLTGSVQSYIFTILASVFIASAAHESEKIIKSP